MQNYIQNIYFEKKKEKDLKSVKEEVRTQIEETIKCYPVVVQRASVPEVFEEDDDEQEE